jgi:hypothetical protein
VKDKEYYTRIPNYLFKDLRSGKISPSMFVALSILHHWADWETARVEEASAGGLETWSAKAYCEDTYQRALQRADAQGYIDRSEMVPGSKQAYPITLHNYPALIEEVDELPNGDVRSRWTSEVINRHETSWWKESGRGMVKSTQSSTQKKSAINRKQKACEEEETWPSTQESTDLSGDMSEDLSGEMSDKPRLNRASNRASSESEKESEKNTSTSTSSPAVFVLSNPKPKSKPESMSDGNLQVQVAVETPVSIPVDPSASIPVKPAVPTPVPVPPVPSARGDAGTVTPAKFAGTCPACGNPIACGEMILLKDGAKARHVSCPTPVHAPAPSRKGRLRGKARALAPPSAAAPPYRMTPHESRKPPVPCRTSEGIRQVGKGTPQGKPAPRPSPVEKPKEPPCPPEPPPKKACPPEQEKEERKNAAYYSSSFDRKVQGVKDEYGYVEELWQELDSRAGIDPKRREEIRMEMREREYRKHAPDILPLMDWSKEYKERKERKLAANAT